MNKNFRAEYEKQLSYFIDQRKDLKKIDLILNHCNFSGITKSNVKEIFIIFTLYHFLAIFFTITSGLLIIYNGSSLSGNIYNHDIIFLF